jgi:acetolactate synthase small subunit
MTNKNLSKKNKVISIMLKNQNPDLQIVSRRISGNGFNIKKFNVDVAIRKEEFKIQ